MEQRVCRKCRESKPITEFRKNVKTGLTLYCKECLRRYDLLYKNPTKPKKKIYINLKEPRQNTNIHTHNDILCQSCKKVIISHDREARVDAEYGDDDIYHYHLSCYDLHVFGYIRHSTRIKMQKLNLQV